MTVPPPEAPTGTESAPLPTFEGLVRISGPDGVTWDIVPARLTATGSRVEPFRGELYRPEDAAMGWWSGPVTLTALRKEGSATAILSPGQDEAGTVVVRVSGTSELPWDSWVGTGEAASG